MEQQCSAVFIGLFYSPEIPYVISLSELREIRNWSMERPENLVVVSEDHAGAWNYKHLLSESKRNFPTAFGSDTRIFRGPFGAVTEFDQGGHSMGYLSAGQGTPLAINEKGQPTIILDRPTHDLILGDVDLLTALGGVSSNSGITNNSDVLMANFWAYACELAIKTGLTTQKLPMRKLTFEKSSPDLTPLTRKQLDSIAIQLRTNTGLSVEVRGYTDIIGDAEANLALSRQRAETVREYLVSNGIKRRRIRIKSLGAQQALYLGKDEMRKAENRRVEIRFLQL